MRSLGFIHQEAVGKFEAEKRWVLIYVKKRWLCSGEKRRYGRGKWGAVRRPSQLSGVWGCEECGGRRGEASG